ncbi:hypothetical protein ACFOUP_11115 [Belliella kenyensis]|uniref:Uncharacterized protein n=2 Tax=Belliella kenyensis TaxID=1472724 RepID=A0ABV8EN04_9BACT|nr:hypothetical protein [Belliella kenyensis]MCH7403721.1 hypothetical protein [Belliella kenyensis]
MPLLLVTASLKAQITGMGTVEPHSSTVLEVSSDNQMGGVLLPRLALSSRLDASTIPNPSIGLLVYNLVDAGSGEDFIEANRIYFWDGTRWVDIADRQLTKRLLLPPVFFAQCEGIETAFDITGTNLTNLNNGTGIVVPFPTNSVLVNNFNNLTLNNNNTFRVNSSGVYELSAFINYNPRVINGYNDESGSTNYNNARTALEFRVQLSKNSGSTWQTIATSRSTWSLLTGSFFRNVVLPPVILKDLEQNDLLRIVIARPNNYGGTHGNSGSIVSINVGEGTFVTRNIRILKIE